MNGRELASDVLVVLGSTLLSYGAWLWHPEAGFATGGILLIAMGFIVGAKS